MANGESSYRRFLAGDDEGMVEIIRDYKDGLILFLNRYVGSLHTAEDLAEETFFKLVTKKPRFTPKYSFKTWLYTVGRNEALTYLRHQSRFTEMPTEDIPEYELLETQYLKEEEKRSLSRALDSLSTDYQTVLHLKYFEDMQNEQIAEVMKKNKRQIENLLYCAKNALRAVLNKEDFL